MASSKNYVEVENYSNQRQLLHDWQLPGGCIELAPGERYGLPVPVFHRHVRAARRWMRRYAPEAAPAADYAAMKMTELREIAKERGITVRVGMSKADVVTLLQEG